MAWNEPGGNDNDPWGNRKNNNGGPPDLDEVIKNVKNWFNSMLGSNGGGGGNNRNSGSGGGLPGGFGGNLGSKGLGVVVAILGAVWIFSGIYVVQPAQAAVVTQFGAFVRTTAPGPHWHLPWPFQAVEKIDVDEIRSARLTNQLILTQDENIVDIDLAVQYNIKSAEDYIFNVRGPDRTLEEVVESAVREIIGSTVLESVLTTGRDEVWNTTSDSLQEVLDNYGTGIFITAVNLERAQPPDQVQAAFSDAIKAREDKERTINEARAYSNQVLPRARGDAQRALEESEAYKTRVEQSALGESERFLSLLTEYKKAPAVTRERLYLEAMETVMSNTSKVMVDNDGGNSLMYLPIDQLVNQNRSSSGGMMSGDSPLNSGSNDSPRFNDLPRELNLPNREDLRSRDRGAIR